jgi:hypothetical protein
LTWTCLRLDASPVIPTTAFVAADSRRSVSAGKWDRAGGEGGLQFITSGSSFLFPDLVDIVDTNDCTDQPDDATQEAESLSRLPSIAIAIIRNAVPAVGHAAAWTVVRVDKDTECREPGGCENQIHRPSVEPIVEGKQAQQAEEDGDSSNHLSEDESLRGPTDLMTEEREVGSDDAGHHLEAVSPCSAEVLGIP